MHCTLRHEGSGLYCAPLEEWPHKPALDVYVAGMPNGEKYLGLWAVEEWQEGDRTGRNHMLYASGRLHLADGVWSGDIVHLGRGSKVKGWRAVARKGSARIDFEALP